MILAVSLFPMNRYGDSIPVLKSDLPAWLHKVRMLVSLLQANPWFVALAAVLAASAALLPDARKRGFRGIALLGACQIGLILLLAPTLSTIPIVLGTLALCAVLAARTFQAGRYP